MLDEFDNLDDLRIDPALFNGARAGTHATKKPENLEPVAKTNRPFTRAYHDIIRSPEWKSLKRSYSDILLELIYAAELGSYRKKPVPATEKTTRCEDSKTRTRALKSLEKAGFMEIDWRGNGQAPLVRLKCL